MLNQGEEVDNFQSSKLRWNRVRKIQIKSHAVPKGITDFLEEWHFCWARDKQFRKGRGQVSWSFRAAVTKILQIGWLKQQILISHISGGWGVQDLSDNRFSIW